MIMVVECPFKVCRSKNQDLVPFGKWTPLLWILIYGLPVLIYVTASDSGSGYHANYYEWVGSAYDFDIHGDTFKN